MKTKKGFTTLAIIIGLLVIGGGAYLYTNNNSEDNIINQEGDVTIEESIVSEPPPNNYYEILEANIRFVIPNELESMFHTKDSNSFWLNSKKLSDLSSDCKSDYGALGVLIIEETSGNFGRFLIDDGNSYVYYTGPQAPCSFDSSIQKTQSNLLGLLNEALETIEFTD